MRTLFSTTIGGFLASLAIVLVGPVRASGDAASTARPVAPRLLSETGLYASGGGLAIDARTRTFAPQYPLWSDGAKKRRWMFLPPGTSIDATRLDTWVFPIGTKFWKEFSFDGRKVETRFLWRASDRGWVFASYVWNEAQTDAERAPDEGRPRLVAIAPGRRHSIPSVEDCHACHDSTRTEVLGFTALQLSDDRDPNAIHGEPLEPGMVTLKTLLDQGVLKASRSDLVSNPPAIHAGSPQARAVLGYLSTNCGGCHNSDGPMASLEMLLKQPAHDGDNAGRVLRTTAGVTSTWQLPGTTAGANFRIVPGVPELSALVYRMKSRRPSSQMPPLGTVVPDQDAIDAVTKWITDEVPR